MSSTQQSAAYDSKSSPASIAGATIGSLALVSIVAFITWWFRKRRNRVIKASKGTMIDLNGPSGLHQLPSGFITSIDVQVSASPKALDIRQSATGIPALHRKKQPRNTFVNWLRLALGERRPKAEVPQSASIVSPPLQHPASTYDVERRDALGGLPALSQYSSHAGRYPYTRSVAQSTSNRSGTSGPPDPRPPGQRTPYLHPILQHQRGHSVDTFTATGTQTGYGTWTATDGDYTEPWLGTEGSTDGGDLDYGSRDARAAANLPHAILPVAQSLGTYSGSQSGLGVSDILEQKARLANYFEEEESHSMPSVPPTTTAFGEMPPPAVTTFPSFGSDVLRDMHTGYEGAMETSCYPTNILILAEPSKYNNRSGFPRASICRPSLTPGEQASKAILPEHIHASNDFETMNSGSELVGLPHALVPPRSIPSEGVQTSFQNPYQDGIHPIGCSGTDDSTVPQSMYGSFRPNLQPMPESVTTSASTPQPFLGQRYSSTEKGKGKAAELLFQPNIQSGTRQLPPIPGSDPSYLCTARVATRHSTRGHSLDSPHGGNEMVLNCFRGEGLGIKPNLPAADIVLSTITHLAAFSSSSPMTVYQPPGDREY